jgi:uncharacterized coiled-coil protein SlyX
VASRLWPVTHRRFDEMCALAVTGQLGGPQMHELNEHIAVCDSCRKYLESIAEVSLQTVSLLVDKDVPEGRVAPPVGMRDRFLTRVAAEDPDSKQRANPHPSPVLVRRLISLPLDQRPSESAHKEKASKALLESFSLLLRSGAALAACAVVGVAGYYIGQRQPAHAPAQTAMLSRSSSPVPQESIPAGEQDRVGQLQQQKSELARKLAGLKDTLATTAADDASLHDQLVATKEKLARLTAQVEGNSQQSSTPQGEGDEVSTLQAQVGNLSQRLAESEVKLDFQKQTSNELSAKLEAATSDLQRERDLKSAKSEMGDLVAARNLHIVDVYDADGTGNRQRPFGRVFYIEGKSLVFYAYDLDDTRLHKANVVFHVWGGKAGAKQMTHSLGILNKDASGDSRWAMTFDDPHVLGQINSVFVTAEPDNKNYDEPRGKKILYAYFGSAPNHP